MNKKISLTKSIKFPSIIGEICSISLEKDLKFMSEELIEGDLLLTGKYKLTEASLLEEDFSYKIPIEITLSEGLDIIESSVDIADFYYEIENDDTMICYIDLEINGTELKQDRECDGEIEEKEIEIPVNDKKIEELKEDIDIDNNIDIKVDEDKEIKEEVLEEKNVVNDKGIFQISDEDDSYGTFIVYIVRENETVNSILEKYHTTLEIVEQYNDLKEFNVGMKLIIPLVKEDE